MLISTQRHRGHLYHGVILKGTLHVSGFETHDDGIWLRREVGRFLWVSVFFKRARQPPWQLAGQEQLRGKGMWHDSLVAIEFLPLAPQQSLFRVSSEFGGGGEAKTQYNQKMQSKSRTRTIKEKMLSPSAFLGSLVFFTSHLGLFSLLQPH